MKLVLVFSDEVSYEPGTLYLVARRRDDLPEAAQKVVVGFDSDTTDLRDEADLFRDAYAASLGNPLLRDAFIANFHNFYFHIFRNIYKWVVNLDALLQTYPNAQVEITDAVSGSYMPLYEAEGEINKHLLYKAYDFIPEVLYQYLQQRDVACIVGKRHSRIWRAGRIFLRRYLLLAVKPLFYSLQILRHKKGKVGVQPKNQLLLLSRSIVHTHFLYPLTKVSSNFVILFSEGFFTRGINSRFFQDRPCSGVDLAGFYSLVKVWRHFTAVLLLLAGCMVRSRKTAKLAGLTLPMRSVLREMLISYYDALLYGDAVKGFVQQNGSFKAVITAETFTQYPYAVKQALGKTANIKLVQVAAGALDIMPNVRFVYADRVAIISESVFKDYQRLHPAEKDRMVYWGDTKHVADAVVQKSRFHKLLYFSQPYEYESQECILTFLHQYATRTGTQVGVKMHPRDQLTREVADLYGFEIVETTSLFSEYIYNYDLAISRTSSILKDIILSGVPFVSALFSEQEQRTYSEFIQPEFFTDYSGIYAFGESDLESLLQHPARLCADCDRFLQHYKIHNVNKAGARFFADAFHRFAAQ